MVTHGIIENRFLHVNKLEKRNGWKIKKTAGHVLWPEEKIRVWYPGETRLDISRQALKDVSVSASFSLTKAARRRSVGFCFSSTLLVSNTMPGLFPKSCTRMSSDLTENSTLRFFTTSLSSIHRPDILKWPFTRPLNEAKHDHWMCTRSVKSSATNFNQSRRLSTAVKHWFAKWRATTQNPGGSDMSNSQTAQLQLGYKPSLVKHIYQWIGAWYIRLLVVLMFRELLFNRSRDKVQKNKPLRYSMDQTTPEGMETPPPLQKK